MTTDVLPEVERRQVAGRPKLLVFGVWPVAALAAVLYGWGIDHAELQPYYTAAVRSMAISWHAFLYGAVDQAGSITLDKLPGAFWLQALSVRVFGPRVWAVALPQAVEGVVTVLVLHRVVREWAGEAAALVAAVVLALTPITVVVARHSMADTLLVLLLVLGAWACQWATRTGRLLPLLVCAACVGLGFQVKMLQAWLVLPAFTVAYLAVAPGRRRIGRLVVAGAVMVAVSSVWLALAVLTPADDRPFVDGTTDNDPLSMVVGYNALSRFESGDGAHWDLLVRPFGASQVGWLLPVAVGSLVLGVLRTRGRERAGWLMWGSWLAAHVVVFGASHQLHVYYTVVLTPALAALSGAGAMLLWRAYRETGRRAWALPVVIALAVGWAVRVGVAYPDFAAWTVAVVAIAGVLSAGVLAAVLYVPGTARRLVVPATITGVLALLTSPAVWSVSALDHSYAGTGSAPAAGEVGREFRAQARRNSPSHTLPAVALDGPSRTTGALLDYLTAHHRAETYVVATERARLAEPLLRLGVSVLPMGGFSGRTPYPTPERLAGMVSAGTVRYALLSANHDPGGPPMPAANWVRQHCHAVPSGEYKGDTTQAILYDCKLRP